jgi:glucose/arabinose dehydrogenase
VRAAPLLTKSNAALLSLLGLPLFFGCRTQLEAASPAPTPAPANLAKLVRLEKIATSTGRPVFLAAAPGDRSGRVFVVEQTGTIRILRPGAAAPEPAPFLDLTARSTPGIRGNAEQGLLGLAFHPTYAESGRFFVNFTDREGDTRIVEFRRVAGDPDRADPASAREVLKIDQPYANHNGGHLLFGPDGKLWVGTGDGGSANDPHGNGQSRTALLGKMLRLDVERENPTAEIVAIGLRNPWRYDFDPDTGDLFIADVGQNQFEEIDVAPAAKLVGHNFGWNVLEGLHCFRSRDCDRSGMTDPVVEYSHDEGCSITGGIVYRGRAIPELHGTYFYSDYCTAILRGFRWRNGEVVDHWDWKGALDPDSQLAAVSSFGRDADGEMYVLSLDGAIWKMVRRRPKA